MQNSLGTGQFTIAFRIDRHHAQTGNPCTTAPPHNLNILPTTDPPPPSGTGLKQPAGNLLYGLNCGPLGCPPNGGWVTFAGLNLLCRPSGDWVMRTTWTRLQCLPGFGACCLPNGTCQEMAQGQCVGAGGVYQGDGSQCAFVSCVAPDRIMLHPRAGVVRGVTQQTCSRSSRGLGRGGDHLRSAGLVQRPHRRRPDLTTTAIPGSPGYGIPNGILNNDDFFYYLEQFATGNAAVADLTHSTIQGRPGTESPDRVINNDDFFYYLVIFAAGC